MDWSSFLRLDLCRSLCFYGHALNFVGQDFNCDYKLTHKSRNIFS